MPENKLLMLDTEKMKFSVIDLPLDPCPEEYDMIFVETTKERLGMFTIYDAIDEEHGGSVFHLVYSLLEKDGGSTTWWLSMAMISLPLTCRRYRISGVAGGYLLLKGVPKGPLSAPSPGRKEMMNYFSVNLESLQLEQFCGATEMFMKTTSCMLVSHRPCLRQLFSVVSLLSVFSYLYIALQHDTCIRCMLLCFVILHTLANTPSVP
jgi:hypothetical protein